MVQRPQSSRTQRHGIVFSVASTMSRAKHDPMQAEIGASHSMQRRWRKIAPQSAIGETARPQARTPTLMPISNAASKNASMA